MKRTKLLCYATLPDGHSFTDCIEAAARAGFTELSLWLMTLAAARTELGSLQAVRDCLDAHGMRATSIELLLAWPRGDAAAVAQETAVMAAAVEMFEPELIMAGCMEPTMEQGAVSYLRQQCRALAPIPVALEFLPWSAVPSIAAAREVVAAVAEDNLGFVIDSWHFVRAGCDYTGLAEIPGDKIFFIQLSDVAAEVGEDIFAETLGGRLSPGEGVVDWPRFVGTLRQMGVNCPIGTEQFSDRIKAMPLQAAADYLYQGLQYPFDQSQD
jgi:sugar phosphate isomerase/epimerase